MGVVAHHARDSAWTSAVDDKHVLPRRVDFELPRRTTRPSLRERAVRAEPVSQGSLWDSLELRWSLLDGETVAWVCIAVAVGAGVALLVGALLARG